MVICPNCKKRLREGFDYCRICGSKLDGEVPGDYSTDRLNVFSDGDGYMYLYSEKGNQVVIKAGSMDELEAIVADRQYPWESRDWKSNVSHAKRQHSEMPLFKSEFLKASALKQPEVIETASFKKKKSEDESYVPDYVVENVVDE